MHAVLERLLLAHLQGTQKKENKKTRKEEGEEKSVSGGEGKEV
jgi:hypothetical protein